MPGIRHHQQTSTTVPSDGHHRRVVAAGEIFAKGLVQIPHQSNLFEVAEIDLHVVRELLSESRDCLSMAAHIGQRDPGKRYSSDRPTGSERRRRRDPTRLALDGPTRSSPATRPDWSSRDYLSRFRRTRAALASAASVILSERSNCAAASIVCVRSRSRVHDEPAIRVVLEAEFNEEHDPDRHDEDECTPELPQQA